MGAERTTEEPAAESEDRGRKLDLMEEIGGPQGIADSSIPALVFVAVYALAGNRISLAGLCAIAAGLAIAALRLAKGESLKFAFTGFIGVAVAAFIADRTGRAEDFFLPGLLLNAAYGAAFLISILIRRPLLGVILGPTLGGGKSWRADPQQLRAYSRASWIWVGVFTTRFAVQMPFYLAGSLIALGIARAAMGLPIFVLAIWLSYVTLKRGGIQVPEAPWRRPGSTGRP